MILLVDIGNSRIKWAVYDGQSTQDAAAITHDDSDFLTRLNHAWSTLPRPEAMLVASVANTELNQRITEQAASLWSIKAKFIRSQSHVAGLLDGYQDYQQLGVDRWLAMIAAIHLYTAPLCIVDIGTAITFDVVGDNKEHLGGYIIPGFHTAGQMLADATHHLMPVDSMAVTTDFGLSMHSCLSNGYTTAVLGFIKQAVVQANEMMAAKPHLIITGGGAQTVLPLLAMDYIYEKDLVLLGLTYTDHIK